MSEEKESQFKGRQVDILMNQYTMLRGEINRHYDKQYQWLIYCTSANGAILFLILRNGQTLSVGLGTFVLCCMSLCVTIFCYYLFDIDARTAEWKTTFSDDLEKILAKENVSVKFNTWGEFYTSQILMRRVQFIGTRNVITLLFVTQGVLAILALSYCALNFICSLECYRYAWLCTLFDLSGCIKPDLTNTN